MISIPPLEITAARLTSTTAPEPGVGEAAYNPATAYAKGDRAILGAPSATVTLAVGSPGVVTWAGHNQPEGTPLVLTTTGALLTGATPGRSYFVRNPGTNTLQLAETVGGVPVVFSGTQSGTHTATTQIHRVYESQQAGNVGHYPAHPDSSAWWKDAGPTNRHAMFDTLRNSQTCVDSPLTVVITPGQRVDAIALLGVEAESVTVTMSVGGSPVYSVTADMIDRDTASWYSYFFGRFGYKPSLALFDLPPFTGGVITVTFTNASGQVKCGALVVGTQVYLGSSEQDAVSDSRNFSTVDRTSDGTAVMKPSRRVPQTKQRMLVDAYLVDQVRALREQTDAVPAVWSNLDDDNGSPFFNALLILGFHTRFLIRAKQNDLALIELDLEEV